MDLIRRGELTQLAERHMGTQVSLFAPTFRMGAQTTQNQLRWKNLLRQTESALRADGARPTEIDALLDPARTLVDDAMFWEYQSNGLAFFGRAGWSRYFRLPIDLPELAAVGDRFVIAPLLQMLTADGRFLLLALSQQQVRLFEGTRFGIEEMPLPDLPSGPTDATQRRDTRGRPESFLADRGGSGTDVVFFGHGGGAERQRREETLRYFRAVDSTVQQFMGNERPPLVLAGVAFLLPLYRQASSYPRLIDGELLGNPNETAPDVLHGRAWTLLEPVLRHTQAAAAARYRELAGTGITVNDPPAVLAAAAGGRVDALFLSTSAFERQPSDGGGVIRLGTDRASVPDQLDRAVAACLAHGGSVHAIAPDQMPDSGPVAALLRF